MLNSNHNITEDTIIYGVHPLVETVLTTGFYQTDQLYIKRNMINERLKKIIQKASKTNVKIIYSTHKEISEILEKYNISHNVKHQGIVLVRMELYLYNSITLAEILNAKKQLFLILDRIKDPQNLGSIIRTSLALGVKAILLSKKNSAPLGSTASKVSSGAMSKINFLQTLL